MELKEKCKLARKYMKMSQEQFGKVIKSNQTEVSLSSVDLFPKIKERLKRLKLFINGAWRRKMKYEIWQVSEEGFIPCNQKWNDIETDYLERDMNSFAEWLGETAMYSMEDNTVADDYGNKFVFRRVL